MNPRLIVIGASLGGLKALRALLGALPAAMARGPAALAVAQHRDASGGDALALLLGEVCVLPVREAQDKTPIRPGTVTLAPADYHLLVEGEHFALMASEATDSICPSIDALFESAAEERGAAVIGVVLTGTGSDGARGLAAIARAGGGTGCHGPGRRIAAAGAYRAAAGGTGGGGTKMIGAMRLREAKDQPCKSILRWKKCTVGGEPAGTTFNAHRPSGTMLAASQAFRDESQHQRIEGHPFGLGAGGQFGVNGLRHAGNESAGGVGQGRVIRSERRRRNLPSHVVQRRHHRHERIASVLHRLGLGFAIRHASRQIGKGDQKPAAFRWGQRTDDVRISLKRPGRNDAGNHSDFITHACDSLTLSTSATNWRTYTGLMGRCAGTLTTSGTAECENT